MKSNLDKGTTAMIAAESWFAALGLKLAEAIDIGAFAQRQGVIKCLGNLRRRSPARWPQLFGASAMVLLTPREFAAQDFRAAQERIAELLREEADKLESV